MPMGYKGGRGLPPCVDGLWPSYIGGTVVGSEVRLSSTEP